ncbi:MAG TPA: hypothetical protein PKC85_08560 [Bacteroidia bacterium]|jgi:hypothetical protein|nr:hypothetical protein [Bacteroidia bacterium]HMU19888.1 hypothetical protein [Bacteroidia bacterium]
MRRFRILYSILPLIFFYTLSFAGGQAEIKQHSTQGHLKSENYKSDELCDVHHVKVFFSVAKDGLVKVSSIGTRNTQLRQYILRKLARLNFKGMHVEGNYSVTLSFDLGDKCT